MVREKLNTDTIRTEAQRMRDTLISGGSPRVLGLSDDVPTLYGKTLELMLAFHGSGSRWFGRFSRVHIAEHSEEGRGTDLIFFLRSKKNGTEYVVAADATSGPKGVQKKIQGSTGEAEGRKKSRMRVIPLNDVLRDQLSTEYEPAQTPRDGVGRSRKTQLVDRVPRVILAISPHVVDTILNDRTASARQFEESGVQFRFLEEMYVQIRDLREQWAERGKKGEPAEMQELLNGVLETIREIYAGRWHTSPEGERGKYFSDVAYQKAMRLIVGPDVQQGIKELLDYAVAHPELAEDASENPWPLVKS